MPPDEIFTAAIERSKAARARSAQIGVRIAETRAQVDLTMRRALEMTTLAADEPLMSHPVLIGRLTRLSGRVGRSPVIEEAKGLIADRYGITRGAAFDVLRHQSSHSNRKLRDVAGEVVAGDARPRRARRP
ncbi:MAG TPA: ANTAR domain-containing protein [Gaiellales bacterium]|jgi:AmiR/NasT family two-component response regulator|nr:ANTAR domain-containing protein [Gaiellales bacterium]